MTTTDPTTTSPPRATGAEGRLARRELTTFAAVAGSLVVATMAGAAALGADLAHLDDSPPAAQTLLFGAAFIPAVAAVLARRLTGQRVRGAPWGWRRCSAGWLARAWLAPLVYAGAAAGLVWVLGLGGFDSADAEPLTTALALTIGLVPFTVLALGEELAWRGTVAARAASLTTPFRAALGIGLGWSLFHWPLMLLVPGAIEGAPTWWGVACFTVSVTATAFPLHRIWQRTGSVWAAAVFHAAHNSVLYFVAEPLTTDNGSTGWFAGETGLVLVGTSVAVAAVLWRLWDPER